MRSTEERTESSEAPPRVSSAASISSAWRAPRPLVRISFMVLLPSTLVLQNDFVQRVLHNSRGPRSLEPRNDVAGNTFFNNGVDRDPLRIAELRNGRRIERGQYCEHGVEVGASYVEHQAHLRLRIDGAAQHEGDLIDLFALPRIGQRRLACDQMCLALHHGIDNFEMIGLERAARLSHFDDGIGERGRLDFSCAPAEFDFDADALLREIAFGNFDQFGCDDLAIEVFSFGEAAGLGNREYPANFAAALLG